MNAVFYLPIFEALGHETRLKVFNFIYSSGQLGVKPKEMIDRFGFDSGTLDFHLKKLLAVQLIALKIGCRRGVYCVNQNIPQELLQLFASVNSIHNEFIHPTAVLAESKPELFH